MSEEYVFHYLWKRPEQWLPLDMLREEFAKEALEIGEFMEQFNVRSFECSVVRFGVLKFTFMDLTAAMAFKIRYYDNLISAEMAQKARVR